MGEGLAMGPVVPTSEPPGDRPYDATLIQCSSCYLHLPAKGEKIH